MILVFVDSFLNIAGNPDIKRSGLVGHNIDIVILHNIILTVIKCLWNGEINRFLRYIGPDKSVLITVEMTRLT